MAIFELLMTTITYDKLDIMLEMDTHMGITSRDLGPRVDIAKLTEYTKIRKHKGKTELMKTWISGYE